MDQNIYNKRRLFKEKCNTYFKTTLSQKNLFAKIFKGEKLQRIEILGGLENHDQANEKMEKGKCLIK
jgi:hypothetical protein